VGRGEQVLTLADTWREVFYVSALRYVGPLCVIPGVGLVTPDHKLWNGSRWVDAEEIYVERIEFDGTVHNLHIDAQSEREHSYTLANGQIAHNIFTSVYTQTA
jgi:hypothetical protein